MASVYQTVLKRGSLFGLLGLFLLAGCSTQSFLASDGTSFSSIEPENPESRTVKGTAEMAGGSGGSAHHWSASFQYLNFRHHEDEKDVIWFDDDDDGDYDSGERRVDTGSLIPDWSFFSTESPTGLFEVTRSTDGPYDYSARAMISRSELDGSITDSNDELAGLFVEDDDMEGFESDTEEVQWESETWNNSFDFSFVTPMDSGSDRLDLRGKFGPRILMMGSSFDIFGNEDIGDNDPEGSIMVDVDNNLYGAQVGAEGDYYFTDRLSISGSLFFGGYLADITQETEYFSEDDDSWRRDQSKTEYGILGELNVGANFDLNDQVSFHLGYHYLGLSNVGQAIESLDDSSGLDEDDGDVSPDEPGLDPNDSQFDGFKFGVEIRF